MTWEHAVENALWVYALIGRKQRVYKDPVHGWTYRGVQ